MQGFVNAVVTGAAFAVGAAVAVVVLRAIFHFSFC